MCEVFLKETLSGEFHGSNLEGFLLFILLLPYAIQITFLCKCLNFYNL